MVLVDVDSQPERLAALETRHPEVRCEGQPNRGYAGGMNRILARCRHDDPALDFVLLVTPDVELAPDFAERLLTETARHPEAALASGRLLRPDGRIDSAGIAMSRGRRFRDRGSEEADRGQFDRVEAVAAVSGAVLLLRCQALDRLALEGEVFDEDFFSYHEETDLAWRARRLGLSALYVPAARAVHGRGWKREGRDAMPVFLRRHSWKNRYLELIKNDELGGLLRSLPWVLAFEAARLAYALLRDRAVLAAYRDAWRLAPRALAKRRLAAAKRLELQAGSHT